MTESDRQSGASPTSGRCGTTSKRELRQAWILWACGSVFVLVLMISTYPTTTTITDEVCYLSASTYMLNGKALDRSSEAWFMKEYADNRYRLTLFSASPAFSAMHRSG